MVRDFEQYSAWRQAVAATLQRYQAGLAEAGLIDGAIALRLHRTLHRLADDKLSVAFVAEFSRGKSELINAIFFADYGQRILPSGAGRTTMCPTELLYDASRPPSIRLLPIETRAGNLSTGDYLDDDAAWTVLPLNLDAGGDMQAAIRQVSLTRHVSLADAKSYGLYDDDADHVAPPDENGTIEISMWRHAIINFPHPLLKQGLVILDTPGLNAIGTEPELTLNLIPNAHAVLFILAADTGVTRSDIEVWRHHIGAGPGRLVVLNKIDSMWDELRSDGEVDDAIRRQQNSVAHLLTLDMQQVFPVSAQKALVGKINHDTALLGKSRLLALETALFDELIPARKDIIRRQLSVDVQAINAARHSALSARLRGIAEQLHELKSMRGKNQSVLAHMMRRIDIEKKEFDSSLFKLQATRAVFTRLSTELYTSLGMDIVRDDIELVREEMQRSRFFTGVREAVRQYFERIAHNLQRSERKTAEITEMMGVMYRKFSAEHGLTLALPMPFSLARYRQEIGDIEAVYHRQFGTATLLTTSRVVLMEKFFDTIASRVRKSFKTANDDAEAWLKVIMAPLEAQILQYKEQLKHRMASIQRIHDATGGLEQKIEALEAGLSTLEQQQSQLDELAGDIGVAIQADGADQPGHGVAA
ncbi:dynamin family protein [Janthinobacterium agaricidamnosum]|uniref:GTPase n=1 Tax=Janthinobacterium agaricidamnosum NBRC 102515 = DSM 9628 TaxID=1349767 RepID=W0VC82_9BURK|nr:dynamin family protein [Janthinobacterium agaricidamnosum]CDG85496.1 GTPase [Janthinobacterium agaricidamnosum NBRC 102515 = DSM 9628]